MVRLKSRGMKYKCSILPLGGDSEGREGQREAATHPLRSPFCDSHTVKRSPCRSLQLPWGLEC